jgi:hypothetical protein
MIEFIANGTFLDISPDAEFELTYENPILDDDRIPAPWTTDINFPPTHTNKRAFGYLGAMLAEPKVKELAATLVVQGLHFMNGTLIYDGIDEEGNLIYTFSGRDLESLWATKLWALPALGSGTMGIEYMQETIAGGVDGVSAPLIVNKALSADNGFSASEKNINKKYRNTPDTTQPNEGYIPAVSLIKLLQDAGLDVLVSSSLVPIARTLSVLGTWWTTWKPATKTGYSLNVLDSMPDVRLVDLIKDFCKMTCSSVFIHQGKIYIKSFDDVISAEDAENWDGKVSDIFSMSKIEKKSYALGYSGSSDASDVSENPETEEQPSLRAILDAASSEYRTLVHKPSGSIYSCKHSGEDGSEEVLIDKLSSFAKVSAESDENVRNVTIGLEPAASAPVHYSYDKTLIRRMAPVISIPGVGGDRPSKACVTLVSSLQGTDNGYIINPNVMPADLSIGLSLEPASLFERYHKSFAKWISVDRCELSVSVNMSIYELYALPLWRVVRLSGRKYIISKISVRMSAGRGEASEINCNLIRI